VVWDFIVGVDAVLFVDEVLLVDDRGHFGLEAAASAQLTDPLAVARGTTASVQLDKLVGAIGAVVWHLKVGLR